MSENDKNVPLIVCDFYTKSSKRDTVTQLFQKRRFQGFICEILRMIGLLGEKFTFSTPLGQPNFQESQTNSIQ